MKEWLISGENNFLKKKLCVYLEKIMVLDLFFFLTLTLRNVIIFLDATIIIYVLQKILQRFKGLILFTFQVAIIIFDVFSTYNFNSNLRLLPRFDTIND